MQKIALIVAGGKGTRMNASTAKQFLVLNKLPVLMHTLKQFSSFDKIVLVLPGTKFNYWQSLCKKYKFTLKHTLVKGGKTRFQSVKNGLNKIPPNSIVAIHDGVRPLVSKDLIEQLILQVKKGIGVIPILPLKDSIRQISEKKSAPINRSNLVKVQTPQCFLSSEIKDAYTQKFSNSFTDDSSVFESNGGDINFILGEEKNLKITTEQDLKIASNLL